MSDSLTLGVVSMVVALGATTQRITGIGIALIGAPALTLAFGPTTAVPLSNIAALLLNLVILSTTLRHVDWRRGVPIAAASAAVIVPVAHQLHGADPAILQASIGGVVLAAIAATFWLRSTQQPVQDSTLHRVSAGAAAGAFGVAAGLSGPPLAVYAARTAWRGPTFVPTLQGVSVVINVIAVAAAPRVEVSPATWLCLLTAVGLGAAAGSVLAPRVTAGRVEAAALSLAAVGAVLAVATALA